MKLTPGKLAGLKAVSNKNGVIAAVAMDQRGALKKMLGASAGDKELTEFKIAVSRVLTQHASAILLDPEWGLPASRERAGNCGLLLAYEKTGYDKTVPGRLPDLLDLWSVQRLKSEGTDCVKLLLYYSPVDAPHVNDLKHAWVERVGDECRANDIAFFLELIGYEDGQDEKSAAYAKRKPEIVKAYMREFSKPRYGVDALKLEVPINMKFVEGTKSFRGEKVYSKTEAMNHFRESAACTDKPFIYLSAGVTNAEFAETLELAAESGAKYNGVLCGRATWAGGAAVYAEKGMRALEQWLSTEGVSNVENVNNSLKTASSWFPLYGQ